MRLRWDEEDDLRRRENEGTLRQEVENTLRRRRKEERGWTRSSKVILAILAMFNSYQTCVSNCICFCIWVQDPELNLAREFSLKEQKQKQGRS